MELRLNIYNELDEVVKEYTRSSYSLRMRQLKNIIETLELEKLAKSMTGNNVELVGIVGNFVMNSYDRVKDLLMDVFPGLTEEEYDETHVDEVAKVVINIVKYSFNVIKLAGGNGKN